MGGLSEQSMLSGGSMYGLIFNEIKKALKALPQKSNSVVLL